MTTFHIYSIFYLEFMTVPVININLRYMRNHQL